MNINRTTVDISVKCKRILSPKTGSKGSRSAVTTSVQHCTGSSRQCNKKEENETEKVKYLCTDDMIA